MNAPAAQHSTLHSSLIAPATVRLERLLPGPVERVWAYITESKKRATWFCGGEFELRVGGRAEMQFDNNSLSRDRKEGTGPKTMEGVITRFEPMRVLAHTMKWDSGDTEVSYELAPRGKDVLLTITHVGLAARDLRIGVMGGWDVHTGILADILNGVEPRPFWSTHSALEKQYAARF